MPNIELAKEIAVGMGIWYVLIPVTLALLAAFITSIFLSIKRTITGIPREKSSNDKKISP